MSSIHIQRFVFCLLLVLAWLLPTQQIHAGGAAMTFRQTWTVHWATAADSLQFSKFISEEDKGCDVKHCDACRIRYPSSVSIIAMDECAQHAANQSHTCSELASEASQRIVNGHLTEVHDANPSCHQDQCKRCLASRMQLDPPTGKTCSHHDGKTAHYCHGVQVTTVRYESASAMSNMNFDRLMWRVPINAVELTAATAGHAQVLEFRLAKPARWLNAAPEAANDPAGASEETLPALGVPSQGLFEGLFVGAGEQPLQISIQNERGQTIMVVQSTSERQAFDLRSFPQGKYSIEATDGAGQVWQGAVNLQTGNPPNLDLGILGY